MCKTEIFANILNIVSEVTEVEMEDIISDCREQEVIEAKSLLIYVLNKHYNLSAYAISCMLGNHKSNVYYHLNNFEDRKRQNALLDIYLQKVLKLSNKYPKTLQ